jgi:hypothetical protein
VPACSLSEHDPTPHVGQDAARLASLCPTRAHCIRCLVAKVSTPVIGARGPFRAREMRAKKHVATYLRFCCVPKPRTWHSCSSAAYGSWPFRQAATRLASELHLFSWSGGDSNSRPLPCEGSALPAELPPLGGQIIVGGRLTGSPPALCRPSCSAPGPWFPPGPSPSSAKRPPPAPTPASRRGPRTSARTARGRPPGCPGR